MRATARTTIAATAFIVSVTAGDAVGEPRQVKIGVAVQNLTAVSSETLAEARQHVLRIYAAAGIAILWREQGRNAMPDADLHLTVTVTTGIPAPAAARDAVLGVAAAAKTRCGRVAYALWDRIAAFARTEGRSEGMILGHVIAHEIGHLLLPPPSHAVRGIMRERWRPSDLGDAERLALGFTNAQARTMRRRVAAERLLVPRD